LIAERERGLATHALRRWELLMPYAINGSDGTRAYFEDEGGEGAPVVCHGGFLDSVPDVRESDIARALPGEEFRVIYVDHRGLGRSDKPHDPAAYAMPLRVGDTVAVLDELGIERAHFVGKSWGGRLGFGIGEHAPDRVLSLVIGGNQPYAWPDSPLVGVVTEALRVAREEGTVGPLVRAFEDFWGVAFPDAQRARWLGNDPAALAAAWSAALAEGPISQDLGRWRVPCLIFIGDVDVDFLDGARRAAEEIPNAELLVLGEADHYAAHMSQDEVVRDAVLQTLRR
jgi:pimeloyl-ACP methyl ester carboxylesterase